MLSEYLIKNKKTARILYKITLWDPLISHTKGTINGIEKDLFLSSPLGDECNGVAPRYWHLCQISLLQHFKHFKEPYNLAQIES